MWIAICILLAVGVGIVLTISEKKRQEQNRAKAEERRKKRQAALTKAREANKAAYEKEPHEEDEGEELDIGVPPVKPQENSDTEPQDLESSMEKTQIYQRFVEEAPAEREKDEPKEEKPVKKWAVFAWSLGAAGCILLVTLLGYIFLKPGSKGNQWLENQGNSMTAANADESSSEGESGNENEPEESGSSEPKVQRLETFVQQPAAVASTEPSAWNMTWEIYDAMDTVLTSYNRANPISMTNPASYFALPGIATFRGNNYRSSGSYGTAALGQKLFSSAVWTQATSSLSTSDGESSWTGSGWTGQPLIVQWDEETKQMMNLTERAKNKADLVEVIYATLDGTIYFMDLEDGSYTRDPLYVGMTFKGAGALDPRGYPLMYVGSGDFTVEGRSPHMFIISLIDGSILYEYGAYDPIAMRSWCAFDSAPLVDAETDTLIWPGENGVLYTIRLNTVYDKAAGTISVDPELTARTRYSSGRSGSGSYWLGYECSASVMDHYIYLSENGGMFYCVDLNTMELVWVQDTKDDSNSSPVAELDSATGRGYIYTAPSLHWTAEGGWGSISIYRLDALTGEILWEKEYECGTVEGVSGGVQATPVLGKEGTNLEDLVIYPIARTPDYWGGLLVALNKETGEEVWRWQMDAYTWSSPVAVYNENNEGYLVVFDSQGYGYLLDGTTGRILDETSVGSLVEASPAVYEDRIVVGTRGQQIYAIDLK